MSCSAADHYKARQASRKVAALVETSEYLRNEAAGFEEQVSRLEDELQRVRHELEGFLEEEQKTQYKVARAQLDLNEANIAKDRTPPETPTVDHRTGLAPGEKFQMVESEQADYLQYVLKVRYMCQYGMLDKARETERLATEQRRKLNHLLDPRMLSTDFIDLDNSAFVVNLARFPRPKSTPSEQILNKTIQFAMENPKETDPQDTMSVTLEMVFGDGFMTRKHPKGVCNEILKEIRKKRLELLVEHAKAQKIGKAEVDQENKEQEVSEGAQEEGENEDQEDGNETLGEDEDQEDTKVEETFHMDEIAWEAVTDAVSNVVKRNRAVYEKQLVLPTESSAPIARYNPDSHFSFQSEQALNSVAPLDNALTFCQLRSWPPQGYYCGEKAIRRPFEIETEDVSGCDVDGDLIASCGSGYINTRPVQCPVNLDAATGILDLKDSQGECTLDAELIFENEREYFTGIVADAANNRIWASSSRKGKIACFSSVPGLDPCDRASAILAFDNEEKKAQRRYCNGSYDIIRCGSETIVGSAGTNRLSVWGVQNALDEYPGQTEYNLHASNDEETDDEDTKIKAKRPKSENYKGCSPQIVPVEDDDSNFETGDIQWLRGSSLIIAPSRGDGATEFAAMRLFDIETGSVTGLLSGIQENPSVEKQYCVESNQCVFTADVQASSVWDLRTYRPVFTLYTEQHNGQVIGIPGSGTGNMFAFTFELNSEHILCWDLRMPAWHAYTMATGNNQVLSLHWHERTSSLLASTRCTHKVDYGRYMGKYMYGEVLNSDDESEMDESSWWPHGAKHEKLYFGSPYKDGGWNCRESALLQYSFENGGPIGA